MRTIGTHGAARAAALFIATGLLLNATPHATPRAAAETAAARDAAACDPARFKIALDVGHTVENQGATSARGVKEYVFNLRLAQDMEAALKDAGFTQTHLFITHGATRAQLFTRVARANALAVDLFVSIHHNDVQEQFKSKWEYNGATYSYSDKYSGHSLFVSRENARFNDSLAFGRLLGAELKSRGLIYTRHHLEDVRGERRELLDPEGGVYRYDRLVVLMYTKVPALLVEAGIIVNRNDEPVLESPEYRAVFTSAMVAAVKQYCGVQQAKAAKAARAGRKRK
jgi:N-acetylmuramoyl-L-alanine amidase